MSKNRSINVPELLNPTDIIITVSDDIAYTSFVISQWDKDYPKEMLALLLENAIVATKEKSRLTPGERKE